MLACLKYIIDTILIIMKSHQTATCPNKPSTNTKAAYRSKLHDHCVLVLNKNWQAISVISPADAFSHIVAGTADGLDIDRENNMSPADWSAWAKLEVREHDYGIGTARGTLRVPTIIILKSYNKVPLFRPKFGLKALWLRDGGICQYSGKPLNYSEASIDHVLPASRGGETSWENCVLCDRLLNSKKGDKTPAEAGLKLRSAPYEPKAVPVTLTLKNTEGIKEWQIFLVNEAA